MSADHGAVPQPVHVRSYGTGPRRVLALHCTIAHSGAWRGLAGEFGDAVTLVAPDMLSHGRSPDWDRAGDYQDRNVDAVQHLLDAPMDLVGHSFGATVALRLAVAWPHLVRSLTLIEPVYFAVAMQDDPDLVQAHHAKTDDFRAALLAGDDALAARLFNRMWSTPESPRWDDLPEQTRAAMTRSIHVVPACDGALFEDHAGMLAPGVLSRAAMPTLLLSGGRSPRVMGVINDGLARRLPDARAVTVAEAGHMLPISHPAETGALMRDLFDRAPA